MIEKNVVMLYIGDDIPDYVLFSINQYRIVNPDFNIQFLNFKLSDIYRISKGKIENVFDECLYESIQIINNVYKNRNALLDKYGKSFIDYIERTVLHKNYNRPYVKVFILNIIIDLFKELILRKIGGIYVDNDTFPIKRFDEKILNQNFYCIMEYSRNKIKDGFFFGLHKDSEFKDKNGIGIQPAYSYQIAARYKDCFYRLDDSLFAKLNSDNVLKNYYIMHFLKNDWINRNNIVEYDQIYFSDLFDFKLR